MADYDAPVESQKSGSDQNRALGCYKSYVLSIHGILKLVEIVLSLVTFICASSNPVWVDVKYGGGFVQFVSIFALIVVAVIFILKVTNVISKIPGPIVFIEFIFYIVMVVCYLICGILSAVRASEADLWYIDIGGDRTYYTAAGIAAAAFFSFVCMIVFGVDWFFRFKDWRTGTLSTPPPKEEQPAEKSPEAFQQY